MYMVVLFLFFLYKIVLWEKLILEVSDFIKLVYSMEIFYGYGNIEREFKYSLVFL